jgi:transcriptional regulator with XRE-family HTH domain
MQAIVIRAIRRQKGWTRKDMALVLGVSKACVGRVERGEEFLKEEHLRRLGAATGAKIERML